MTDGEMRKNPYSLSSFLGFINDHFVPLLLAVLLLAGGFYAGSLWTENQLLKSGGVAGGTGAAGTGGTGDLAAAPTGPTKDQLSQLPEVSNDDHVRGNKNAKVTLVEYTDFECPYCKQFHPTTTKILEEYGDKVRLVLRNYPLPFHANAQKAAEAAECVAKLSGNDAYWKFVDLYFERTTSNGNGIALDAMAPMAAEAGANQAAVQKCLDSGEMAERVKTDMEKGSAAGVTGTPGTFIVTEDGVQEIIPGALPFESVKASVDKYL